MIVDLSKRWMGEDMACLRRNPEMFFIDHGPQSLSSPGHKLQQAWDRAKKVCETCPVIRECARDSLGELEGVWGGLDPLQRMQLRAQHGRRIHELEGPLKQEYAKLAYDLRADRNLPWNEIGRLIGVSHAVAQYLHDWHVDWLSKQEVTDLELPEQDSAPGETHVNARFPSKPPKEGDAWIRYGRRVVWGYYLGQTEDDAWFNFKVKLLSREYSVCWIKAQDVKFTRNVTRNVLVRSGKSGSRIYGTHLSPRRGEPAQAG